MELYPLILRILHIGAGVFWAGATWTLAGFLTPAVKATGASGQEVIGQISGRLRLSDILGVAAVTNAVSGLLLYWRLSSGLNSNWLASGPGIGLTVGALAGIVAFFVGLLVTRPTTLQIGKVGAKLAATEGPPEPALFEEMGALQDKLEAVGVWISVLLAVAVIAMASAQQLLF